MSVFIASVIAFFCVMAYFAGALLVEEANKRWRR